MRFFPLIFLLCIAPFAGFTQSFDDFWKEVESYNRGGQPRSALEVVERIHRKAIMENNGPQLVKAIVHEIKFNAQFEEESLVLSIQRLEDEVSNLAAPTRQTVHSLLGEMYWAYWQNNNWQIRQRTATDSNAGNLLTWDFKRIAQAADQHYRRSLENPDSLRNATLSEFSPILQGENQSRDLRPTLYHLLLARAIDFYASEDRDLVNFDSDGFYNRKELLGNSTTFIAVAQKQENELSPASQTLILFQNLLREARSVSPKAFLIEDLRRLEYFHRRSQRDDRDSLLEIALNGLLRNATEAGAKAEISWHLAELWYSQGANGNVADTTHQWKWKQAYDLCAKAISGFSEREAKEVGVINCRSLMQRIAQREWSMTAQGAVLPQKPFRFLMSYRNTGDASSKKWRAYVQVARIDPLKYRAESRKNYGEALLTWLRKNSTTAATKTFELPNVGDFRPHSAELPIDGLPVGTYVIFVGTEENLSTSNEAVAHAIVTVSDLTLIKRQTEEGNTLLRVVSREIGNPVSDAKIELLQSFYDRNSRSNDYQLKETLTTDSKGEAVYEHGNPRYNSMIVDVYAKDDLLISADNVHGYRNVEDVRWNTSTSFFLDRAIYRPGQIIHFKGLKLRSNGKDVEREANALSTVRLYDVNGQEVSSLNVHTNAFGTFSGTFIAPTGGLNGNLRIADENGSHSFRMEEYKRPKFEVTMNAPKEQFRVGDTIHVQGVATSYSGVPLTGAEVSYRVTRNARFPYPWRCWGWFPQSNPKQVAFGTTTTDASGQFTVTFHAQPDPLLKSSWFPVFSYSIEADVTDQSGEMQTGNSSVSVGFHALDLSISLPDVLEKTELQTYPVKATNLMGEEQDADVRVSVWRLKSPTRILRQRPWGKADQYVLSEAEYHTLFPNDPYADEQNPETWEKVKLVFKAQLQTGTSGQLDLSPLSGQEAGTYLIEMTATDAFGKEVQQRARFQLTDKTSKKPAIATTGWFHTIKDNYEPGEMLELFLASSHPDVTYTLDVEVKDKGVRTNRIIHTEQVALSNGQRLISIPVTEDWRGNATVHVVAVQNNELLSWTRTIHVPFTNKQLDVKLETFRKEMTPDDTEQWTLRISDKKGRPVRAELLTTMYDASLDILAPNYWALNPYRNMNTRMHWASSSFGNAQSQTWDRDWRTFPPEMKERQFEQLNWFGHDLGGRIILGDIMRMPARGATAAVTTVAGVQSKSRKRGISNENLMMAETASMDMASNLESENDDAGLEKAEPEVKMRSDFSETVFFHPHLISNEKGEISFKFTAPQSLTRWKFMGLATTEDLKIGTLTEEVVTRKQLMITPNYPRFVREGDKLIFQVKVNVLDSAVTKVSASLELTNGLTGEAIQSQIVNRQLLFVNNQAVASWEIDIPEGISAIKFTTKAWSDKHSDGEEKTIPVLPNRMLVTESMPLPVRGKGTHTFSFDKLKNNTSSTLRNHSLTLEFTPNPIWLAVLSLPYMMEYPYECSEQIFSRYYANAIGTHLANSDPKIKAVFDQWKSDAQNGNGDAFQSELDKNPELKQALLTETPWVRDAQNETEQRRRIGELFDTDRMETELQTALKKLKQNQQPDGGWGWFNGLRSDMYITRYIVSGFGKMRKMRLGLDASSPNTEMLREAILFLDEEMVKFYDRRDLKDKDYVPSWTDLHMTYARSFWLDDFALNGKTKTTYNLIVKNIREKWTNLDASQKGLAAVVLKRSGFEDDAKKIIVSLRETALKSEEFGTYWAMDKGYYWYQAPIENHVMILEAFDEVATDADMVREMNIWLLKQKQTQSWETTKATAEACYALLSTGNTNFETEPKVSIQLGTETIDPRTDPDLKTEAGTGYFKTNWTKSSVTSDMGKVTVTKDNDGVAWGAVYWQYFENLDKITGATDNPIKMQRDVMLLEDTENGPLMKKLDANTSLSVGDRVRVKITLETDRHMEYVHLKDMRAASFEPRKQLSGAEFQEGLSFYRSTTDLAMNFFFSYLPKGTFVFEYDLNVTQAGTFSNGISQLQCMYAPEFTTHSEGVKLEVGR